MYSKDALINIGLYNEEFEMRKVMILKDFKKIYYGVFRITSL